MNSIMYPLLLADLSTEWTEWSSGFESDQRFVIVLVLVGCATGLVLGLAGIISGTVSSVHRRRVETEMKRDLVERGMSADEVAKVIECATPPEDATERWIASWACKNKKNTG
jgi:hypothetical protein